MSDLLDQALELRTLLTAASDPNAAKQMAAYLKDQFEFFGVKTPQRRAIQKPLLTIARASEARDVVAFADWCWHQPEREFQYVGCDLLRATNKRLPLDAFDTIESFLVRKSWWDTVDTLAVHTVGAMVTAYPGLVDQMDDWIDSDNVWLARTAIIHQLMYKDKTDVDRLFWYCEARKGDTEFFIRKAIGWALRQYARTDPGAVRTFVAANDDLSGLSKREALKHLS